MKKQGLNGLQYLSFLKNKENWYTNTGIGNSFDIEKQDEEMDKRNKNRSIEQWIEEEIGWKIEWLWNDITFFFGISLPEYFIRGKRGWASSDVWNLSDYLSTIIKETVLNLKKQAHGYPCGTKSMRQWHTILAKIVWTFDVAKNIGNKWIYIPSKKHNRKYYNFIKKQFKSCKHLHIMTKAESIKYEEGWRLFQKYFQSL